MKGTVEKSLVFEFIIRDMLISYYTVLLWFHTLGFIEQYNIRVMNTGEGVLKHE